LLEHLRELACERLDACTFEVMNGHRTLLVRNRRERHAARGFVVSLRVGPYAV
jgi:hypothetical protein